MFGISKNALWAFSIHIFTASGAFFAFLSLVACAESDFTTMFWWLGVALLVDGIDGPLARKLEVKKWWPTWSGDLLDSIIDYVTYAMIPAFALYQSGFLGFGLSFFAAAIIVVTSAIYYADTGMKTEGYGFKGFPVCWNFIVFALFVIFYRFDDAGAFDIAFGIKFGQREGVSMAIVLASAILTFAPIIFVHPTRVVPLRPLTLAMFAIWTLCGFAALLSDFHTPFWAVAGVLVTSVYLYCIGFVLQATGRLR